MSTSTTARLRAAVAVVVLALLATLTGWTPATAQAAKRCADQFTITKPTPPRGQLPGFDNNIPLPELPPSFDYANPGEAMRGSELPSPRELARYGTDYKSKTPGTKEHLFARWNDHIARKPELAGKWNSWRNRYVANMGNNNRGVGYEKLLTETIGLGDDWMCQDKIPGADGNRKYDAVNHRLKVAYEFKSGDRVDARQVALDKETARKTGYKIQYVFGRKPTPAAIRALTDAKLHQPLAMKSTPRVNNPGAPGSGRDTKVLNPDPRVPSRGAANDLAAGSGRNRADARLIQQIDDDFTRDGGRGNAPRRPGGIDFSTMELRYLAETPTGSGVEFAFEADDNLNEDEEPAFGGMETAELTSDALFTWLSLPAQSFWVNLNPDQPDRIIDDTLGQTDAGRVLLQSDLLLKRTHARLMVPDNEVGTRFWDSLRHVNGAPCWLTYRVFIEPKPAAVREDGGQLYILDAPMAVKAEPLDITPPPGTVCEQPQDVREHNFQMIKEIIIPAVEDAVNTAPEYQDLRRVYHSRVAAEWITQRNTVRPNAFDPIIGSGDVSQWPARTPWSAQEVYQEYLKSYREGDFTFTREYEQDGEVLTFEFATGGVDFATSPRDPMPAPVFKAEYPTLPATVTESRNAAVRYEDTDVTWLGGGATAAEPDPTPTQTPTTPPTTQPTTPAPTESAPTTTSPPDVAQPPLAETGAAPFGLVALAAALLVAGSALMVWQRRRRRPTEE